MFYAIIDSILDLFSNGNVYISDRFCDSTISILLFELDAVPPIMLPYYIDRITDMIQHCSEVKTIGLLFNLLPSMLVAIKALEQIVSKENFIETSAYKSNVIESICKMQWSEQWSLSLITNFREMNLDSSQVQQVVKAINKHIKTISAESIPSYVYQFLLYSSTYQANIRLILKGIIEVFDSLDDSEVDHSELRNASGAVMITFKLACQRDPEIGKAFVKVIKANKSISTFTIALLMSLSQGSQQFDQGSLSFYGKAMDIMKDNICESFESTDPYPLHKKARAVSTHSRNGWECCAHGILTLGYYLIDYDNVVKFKSEIHSLGKEILLELFEHHDTIRNSLLERIISKIMENNPRAIDYIDILKYIILKVPQEVFPFIKKIKEVLDFTSLINGDIIAEFVGSIYPLMVLHPSLKDHAILVLRKTMYSREENPRITSISGLVELLLRTMEKDEEKDTIQDIFGYLKRSLSQQLKVREHLYVNLLKIFKQSLKPTHDDHINSKKIRELISGILEDHIKSLYIPTSKSSIPFDLTKCIHKDGNHVSLTDSLPLLLNVATKVISEDSIHDYYSTRDLYALLNQISEQVIHSVNNPQVIEFYNIKTVEGVYNHEVAYIKMSIAEVVMEYVTMHPMEKFKDLNEPLQRLFQIILKERQHIRSTMTSKKKDDSAKEETGPAMSLDSEQKVLSCLLRPSMWSLKFILKVFNLLYKEGSKEATALDIDPQFKHYLYQVSLSLIKSLNKSARSDLMNLACNMRDRKAHV